MEWEGLDSICLSEKQGHVAGFFEHDPELLRSRDRASWQILIIKPTRWTNFSNLFSIETLHVSDSSSVHH